MNELIKWSGKYDIGELECCASLLGEGQVIVSPTKVGYILMATNRAGLEKKFLLKGRPKKKPGVILCSSHHQLTMLAQTNKRIRDLYANCIAKRILLGCILPWNDGMAEKFVPDEGVLEFIQDKRKTSCFVVQYGEPSEQIVRFLWTARASLSFASSANPSGKGNRGCLNGVGCTILEGASFLIEADYYVQSQQPDKDVSTRYEQGVMVSMVDADGALCDGPVVIRKGLSLCNIMGELATVFDSFDYRHGMYH